MPRDLSPDLQKILDDYVQAPLTYFDGKTDK